MPPLALIILRAPKVLPNCPEHHKHRRHKLNNSELSPRLRSRRLHPMLATATGLRQVCAGHALPHEPPLPVQPYQPRVLLREVVREAGVRKIGAREGAVARGVPVSRGGRCRAASASRPARTGGSSAGRCARARTTHLRPARHAASEANGVSSPRLATPATIS